ncbi:endonuclease MutS2 [Bacillus infantis]|uniref:endonuclease MutS2 n=1 Tax=Bacillus infantis TaxID=324767 RepID=UPI002006265D|nr:endonuclease MutS2 [Bacillus infantis]MCK6205295.1 endonuclease MutS2 [Bacillus infantis]
MNSHTYESLDFHVVKENAAQFALTEGGRKKILSMEPSFLKGQIEALADETAEAAAILKTGSSVPIGSMKGVEALLSSFHKGIVLRVEQLSRLYEFLQSCKKLKKYMKDKSNLAPRISSYILSVDELPFLAEELMRCIRNGGIDDHASKDLLKIRKQIAIQEERLKEKLNQILKSAKYKEVLQEGVVSQRNGRYVVPVKKEYRYKIKGSVLDRSASGSTLFIEPEEIGAHQDQLNWLHSDEESEILNILLYLTGLAEDKHEEIKLAAETMIHYDIVFAKGKYGLAIEGIPVCFQDDQSFRLLDARHPSLGSLAVPLTIELGQSGTTALVITGPNTGGKTVAIKTVGLLALMAQCGLLLPVSQGSSMGIFQKILVDIGDGQSIEENLSTFSSRIKNIGEILEESTADSLVLLDELGSGTDPGEGMGLAAAILEQLHRKGAAILATTHYKEIKSFAEHHEGFINGSMEFDLATLKPTYRLKIGESGESQAFAIALKLGIHPKLIERAHYYSYGIEKSYPQELSDDTAKKKMERQIFVQKHEKKREKTAKIEKPAAFKTGDNVLYTSTGELGIIYKGPDSRDQYIVQIKGEKKEINSKRLKLYIKAEELYPEEYDFSIIFDTKENRKVLKQMGKKHVKGLSADADD